MAIVIPVEFDTSALSEIPGDVASVAGRAGNALADGLSKGAQKASRSISREVNKAKKGLQEISAIGSKVGSSGLPGLAAVGRAITVVGDAAEAMATPVGAAGFAIGAIAAPAAVGVAGLTALTTAAIAAVVKFDDLQETLKPFRDVDGFVISSAQVSQVERAGAAIDAIGTVAARLGEQLATKAAPTVEHFATITVAAGLAAVDAFEGVAVSVEGLGQFLDTVTAGPIRAFAQGMLIAANVASGVGEAITGVRVGKETLQELSAEVEKFSIVGGIASQATDIFEVETRDYIAAAKELITVQEGVSEATKKTAKAFKEVNLGDDTAKIEEAQRKAQSLLLDLQASRLDLIDQENMAFQNQLAEYDKLAAAGADTYTVEQLKSVEYQNHQDRLYEINLAMEKEILLARQSGKETEDNTRRLQEQAQEASKLASAVNQSLGGFEALATALTPENIEGQANAALELSKSLALAQITVAGAVATVQAFAQLGPVAGAAVAFGSLATVIATAINQAETAKLHVGSFPQEHTGTGPSFSNGPDERTVTITQHERVVTEDQMQGPTRVVIPIVFRGQTLDTMVHSIANANGAFGKQIRGLAGVVGMRPVFTR